MFYFDNICRTCSLQGELQSLFAEDILNPAEMLTQIFDIKVIKGDEYPQNICARCLDTLRSAYIFKNQCLDAYKKFEQYLLHSATIDCKEELLSVFIKQEKELDPSKSDDDWPDIDNESENNPNDKPYSCIKCDLQFKYQKNYERHLKKHDRLHMCPVCGEQFLSKTRLEQHSLKHSEERPFECEKCSVKFKYRKNYERHFKKHDQLYICPICGSKFTSKQHLEKHGCKHCNEKSFIGEYCEKSLDQCHVKLENVTNETLNSKVTTDKTLTKTKQTKKYLCDYCGRGYPDATKLNAHIRTHTGEKPFSCTECNKFFTDKGHLRQHRRIYHSNKKPYKCDYCEKSFAMSHWLKQHVRIHTNAKPFTCDICNQKFREKHHLTRHKLVHTGEKPFSCSVCNKQFTQKSNLQSHMRTHTGEKPYVCSLCSEVFLDASSMKNHRAKHIIQ